MILEKLVIAAGIFLCHFLNGSTIFDLGPAVKPDFVFLLVIFFALRKGEISGLWVGFFGGLLSDAGLGDVQGLDGRTYYKIGVHSLSFSIVGYMLGKFGRSYYHENFFSISTFSFFLTLIGRGITYIVFTSFFGPNDNYSFIGSSIYNAAIAPLAFFIFTFSYRLEPSESLR
jgi:rod shape-determining protein MreD